MRIVHDAALQRVRRNFSPLVRDHADDIAQEVVVRYLTASQNETIENPAAWANTAAWHLAMNVVRDERFSQPLAPPDDDPGSEPRNPREGPDPRTVAMMHFIEDGKPTSAMGILRQQADVLLAQLDAQETEFVLLVASGYSQAEIADILGYANADVVKTTLNRKRKHLKGIAEGAGLDPDWQDHPRPY